MLMLAFLLLSVLVGYARRGRLRHYLEHPLRGLCCPSPPTRWSFPLARWRTYCPGRPASWLGAAVCLEYAMLFAFVWLNHERKAFWVIAIASLLNFAVIAANGFRMPISPAVYEFPIFEDVARRVGSGEMVEYTLVGWDGPLWWLGDTIPVLWVVPGLASVGDLGLAAGVFALMQEIMCPKKRRGRH